MTTLTFTIPKSLWLSANDRHHFRAEAERKKALRLLGKAHAITERVFA